MVAVVIRDALPQDAAAVILLRKAIFGETNFMFYAPNDYGVSPEEFSAQLERTATSGHSRFILAEVDNALVGFLGISGSSVPRLRHSVQIIVGVLRAYWGQGVGRALLIEALRWAPSAGISRVELFVMRENSRAIALYERLGFRVEGSRRHAYVINGQPVDDLLMAYIYEA